MPRCSLLLLLALRLHDVSGFHAASPTAASSISRRAASTAMPAPTAKPIRALTPLMAEKPSSSLPFLLDPGTKGGILFWTVVLIVLPFVAYNFMLENLGWDVVLAGNVVLVGYVGLGTVAWTLSYVFRVANKDMTYAQQLRDYENAVIQKRFEELSEDEVDALMGEIYPSDKPK